MFILGIRPPPCNTSEYNVLVFSPQHFYHVILYITQRILTDLSVYVTFFNQLYMIFVSNTFNSETNIHKQTSRTPPYFQHFNIFNMNIYIFYFDRISCCTNSMSLKSTNQRKTFLTNRFIINVKPFFSECDGAVYILEINIFFFLYTTSKCKLALQYLSHNTENKKIMYYNFCLANFSLRHI